MEKDFYKLVPWAELSPEAQKFIITNQAKDNEGQYIDPKSYENASFYVDKNGNIAKGKDVDIWLEQQGNTSSNYFSNLWKVIDETYGSGNPLWGDQRIQAVRKAEEHNPNFRDNTYGYLEDILNFANMASAGVIGNASPTHLGRVLYDAVTGEPIFTGENGELGSWWGNNGVIPDDLAEKYPELTLLNPLLDAGLGLGFAKGYEPVVTSGAQSKVIIPHRWFSPRVIKYTTASPSDIHIANQFPGVAKMTIRGVDPATGLLKVTQPRAFVPSNSARIFNKLVEKAMDKGAKVVTHPNLQGIGLKYRGRIFSDFGNNGQGQVGITLGGPRWIDNLAFETPGEFALAMQGFKKGGKLIPKCKNGFVLKFQNAGVFPILQESDIESNPILVTNDQVLQKKNQQLTEKRGKLSPEMEEALGFLYDTISMFDPTGISSWPDVFKAVRAAGEDGLLTLEDIGDIGLAVLSALPMIGKVTVPAKIAKMAKRVNKTSSKILPKINKYLTHFNKPIDTFPELFKPTKGVTAKIQNVVSNKFTNPLLETIMMHNPGTRNRDWIKGAYLTNTGVNILNTGNTVSDMYQVYSDDFKIAPYINKAIDYFNNL